jgi:hypothetical protein
MKIIIAFSLLFRCMETFAQSKPSPNPYRQLGPTKNTLPPQTYQLSGKSDVIHASIDNMPIVYGEVTMTMPNATTPLHRDSVLLHKMPNPLYGTPKKSPKKH